MMSETNDFNKSAPRLSIDYRSDEENGVPNLITWLWIQLTTLTSHKYWKKNVKLLSLFVLLAELFLKYNHDKLCFTLKQDKKSSCWKGEPIWFQQLNSQLVYTSFVSLAHHKASSSLHHFPTMELLGMSPMRIQVNTLHTFSLLLSLFLHLQTKQIMHSSFFQIETMY